MSREALDAWLQLSQEVLNGYEAQRGLVGAGSGQVAVSTQVSVENPPETPLRASQSK